MGSQLLGGDDHEMMHTEHLPHKHINMGLTRRDKFVVVTTIAVITLGILVLMTYLLRQAVL